jgi:hypothetical protein
VLDDEKDFISGVITGLGERDLYLGRPYQVQRTTDPNFVLNVLRTQIQMIDEPCSVEHMRDLVDYFVVERKAIGAPVGSLPSWGGTAYPIWENDSWLVFDVRDACRTNSQN